MKTWNQATKGINLEPGGSTVKRKELDLFKLQLGLGVFKTKHQPRLNQFPPKGTLLSTGWSSFTFNLASRAWLRGSQCT